MGNGVPSILKFEFSSFIEIRPLMELASQLALADLTVLLFNVIDALEAAQ